jgi:ferredoxin
VKIVLDQDKCVASGQCVVAAPEVFDQRDSDGIAVLLQEQVSAEELETVREAARICPAVAIRLEGA